MKPASVDFLEQMLVDATTLCRLWRITALSRATVYSTDHDEDIVFDGNTYRSSNSIECSAIDNAVGGARTNFDFSVVFGDEITRPDTERGIYDGARVEIDYIFYDHVDFGIMALAAGEVTAVSVPNSLTGVFGVKGFDSISRHPLTEQYTPTCRANFCDARCSLDLEDFSEVCTVDSVVGDASFVASEVAAHANAFFDLGTVTWLTGDNAGTSVEIRRSLATGRVDLMVRPAYPIVVGDTVSVARGCDKTVPTCTAYANLVNFRGEPYVPGGDFAEAAQAAVPPGDAGEPPDALPPDWRLTV